MSAWKTALLAGALTSQIAEVSDFTPESKFAALFGNDEALMVVAQWLEVERFLERRPLWKLLSLGRGGQNVMGIGRKLDIDQAAHFDRYNLVAELQRDCNANRGRMISGTRAKPGWALPRSCPKER